MLHCVQHPKHERERYPKPNVNDQSESDKVGASLRPSVAGQKIYAGMIHVGKTATVICENTCFRVVIDGETAAVVPRTTTSEIHRY